MAWCRTCSKPLPETMLTHTRGTRERWVGITWWQTQNFRIIVISDAGAQVKTCWCVLMEFWGTISMNLAFLRPLRWRHNDQDGVSNHQPHGCLLNRLVRRISNKTSKLRVTGLCVGNSPGPVNSPHKGPVTRKMFPFDDVIMQAQWGSTLSPMTS